MKKLTRRKVVQTGALAGIGFAGKSLAQTLRPELDEMQGVDSIIVPQPVDPITDITCELTPETIDGPYYFHGAEMRSRISEDKEGLPIRLGIQVVDTTWSRRPPNLCFPIHNAIVDIWHADALGIYSNSTLEAQGVDTAGQTWCRGVQATDESGYCEFETILPGWYLEEGGPAWLPIFARTIHIHAKIYFRNKVLTTQIYFPNAFIESVYAEAVPYRGTPTRTSRTTGQVHRLDPNEADWVFGQGGPMTEPERGADGYYARAVVGTMNA